ncbi:SERTA domain-containing protein 3 [Melanotaenia boesemani]|uniref:SERTA domain-containing protein 3 n=1 Tax=Melanotaenia boesemani TaxID=1250792 RepID=UPI001C0546BB|nr:SERTA domain-containing protein 3 [Melanotaenia boesemani]XP_041851661.1 SERTA domain-containing protein 3 [Melanotaenia boesemani]
MILKGQKRKLPPEDMEVSERSSPTWESQRQFVFSVSMNKYQRSQELPEPSLRRSVLIANTLRQISLEASSVSSEDMEVLESPCSSSADEQMREQTSIPPVFTSCPVVSSDYLSNCVPARSSASCHSAESNAPMTAKDVDDNWESMSTDSDFSLSAAISSILTALDSTIDGSPQAASRTPLRSLENLSGPSEGGVAWLKQGIKGHGVNWEQQWEGKVQEGSMEARSSYLSDINVEDLFQDIDTSLLERDMGVLGLISSGGGYPAGDDLLRYLPPFSPSSSSSSQPFSLSLNPSLKCLPSFSSFSPLPPPSISSLPASASFSSQNQLREGLELDHLMEILVES